MIVISENGKTLMDAKSIYISEVKDREDRNLIVGYRIMASCETSPRPAVLRTLTGEDKLEEAKQILRNIGTTYSELGAINNNPNAFYVSQNGTV